MICVFLLLLFLRICVSEITLNITAGPDKYDTVLQFTGSDNKVITDCEVSIFNVTRENLNRAVKIELGRVPNNIFLKDPTPYGNLFHKYKWPETHRNLQIEKATVLDVKTEEVLVATHENVNNSTTEIETRRSLFINVENSVKSYTWSESGLPEDNRTHIIINLINSKFKLKNKWRNNDLIIFKSKFGKQDNRILTLKPGKGIIKKLKALKTTITIQVDYIAQLIGNIITDYEILYGKYHFYSPTVNNIMIAGNIRNEVRTTERIEIRCYTDPKIEVYDKESGTLINNRVRLFWKTNNNKYLRS